MRLRSGLTGPGMGQGLVQLVKALRVRFAPPQAVPATLADPAPAHTCTYICLRAFVSLSSQICAWRPGTWVWIGNECECDAMHTCTTPHVDGSPGNTCSPGACHYDDSGAWTFKGCYRSLGIPSTQFAANGGNPTDLQNSTLDLAVIGTAISISEIHGGSISDPGAASLTEFCALQPKCVPPEMGAMAVILEARSLKASEAPVPPCVTGLDNDNKHAVKINTKWFEIQEIVLSM